MTSKGNQIGKHGGKQKWIPPRGIRYFEDPSRPQPFFVQWREPHTKKRLTRSYGTWGDREIKARALVEARDAAAVDMPSFDPEKLRRFAEFERIVGKEVDPVVVAVEWKRGQVEEAITLAEAAERYLKARKSEGIAQATLAHAKMDLSRAVEAFGGQKLANVTSEQARSWVTTLPYSEVTKRNHYKRLNAFYNWAKRERLTKSNPCDNVISPARESSEVTVASVDDIKKLFKVAWKARPAVCTRLALEAFAGLRNSAAARLEKTDVNFEYKGITLPGPKLKTRGRRYIDGLPENLWLWLRAAPPEAWTMTERQYIAAKSQAFALAEVKNPGNVLRHSFCSYHISMHKDAARTAIIICHASPRTLYQHYKGRATSADGPRYFSIIPSHR